MTASRSVLTVSHLTTQFSPQERVLGNPSWRWSHSHRSYPTGWVVRAGQRNSHYRLSIIYAGLEDSGQYRCESEQGLVNSVGVVVTSLECPRLTPSPAVRLNSTLTHLGAVVRVSCPTGWEVAGPSELQCRDDGETAGLTGERSDLLLFR